MKFTDDLTRCETIAEWARKIEQEKNGRVASFGHTVITKVKWDESKNFLPLHDVLRFELSGECEEKTEDSSSDETEFHFAALYKILMHNQQSAYLA
jgi:hypothetical protein